MDEMTAVRKLRAGVPTPDHARLTPARQRLLDEIARGRRPRPGWKLAAVGAAAAVTAAAVLTTLLVDDGGSGPTARQPEADDWVHQVTRWDGPDCGGSGSRGWYGEGFTFTLQPGLGKECSLESGRSHTTQNWIRYDGTQQGRPDRSPETPPKSDGDRQRRAWPQVHPDTHDALPPQQSDALVAALPDDPGAALDMIRKKSRPSRLVVIAPRMTQAQRDFNEVVEVLSGSPTVAPDKAETMYRIITGLDGATKPQKVTDGVGRPAVAIGIDGNFRDYSSERNSLQVLLDPESYAYRGVRFVAGLDYYVGGKASGGPFVAKGTVVGTLTRVSTDVMDDPYAR
ncbi:hypothetical protein OHA27_05675 [Streptomyces sp. NBC_01619]|uniref:Uncharacterized protein n=1 Tax=Streptomyces pratisoli TaxID=3139917 RepID=A0ACC6QD93_9ACTN|nr:MULTISPECIES: hypothetical protein [unclassified Streptomyces]MCX4509803.1 hypothetical protein [Streptomyces sp. NBC_01619]